MNLKQTFLISTVVAVLILNGCDPISNDADESNSTAITQGKALYDLCSGCHGADGQTKALGKSDPIAGRPAAETAANLRGYKAGTLNNKYRMGGVMKGQTISLSDADIQALSAYISTQEANATSITEDNTQGEALYALCGGPRNRRENPSSGSIRSDCG